MSYKFIISITVFNLYVTENIKVKLSIDVSIVFHFEKFLEN